MPRQDKIYRHKKTHGAGGLDCKTSSTGRSSKVKYNLARYLFKPALILLFAVAYVPFHCGLMLTLPLLPTRLANRLIDWLAVDQGGV